MLLNYFRIAIRHILKHRLYSMINILGLAVGMAACLMIYLFVRYETSYDNWLEGADEVCRLNYTNFYPNGEHYICACAPGIAKGAIDRYFTEIEHSTRIFGRQHLLTIDGQNMQEQVWMADREFFEVIKLNFVEGERSAAFDNLESIVLSEEMATKHFGETSPIGKIITFTQYSNDEDFNEIEITRDFQVTGVFEDVPENSEFNFKMIIPIDTEFYQYAPSVEARWYNTWGYLYFTLRDGVEPQTISGRLREFVAENVPPIDDRAPEDTIELSLTHLPDAHLRSGGLDYTIKEKGSIAQVYTFSVIAGLVLLIACINFMNLSTARSMQRAREISMRKVLGADKTQLIRQFLGENIVVAGIGLVLAALIVLMIIPVFNTLSEMSLSLNILEDPMLIVVGLGLLVLIGCVAGLYPAFYLTAFRPAEVLQSGSPGGHSRGVAFRTGLTIFQFAISIALIICTAVVYGQNLYSVNRDLGFTKENKMVLRNLYMDYASEHKQTLANEIERLPGVERVAFSIAVPADTIGWHHGFTLMDEPGAQSQAISGFPADHQFFNAYDIPILYGRNFDENREMDVIDFPEDGEEEKPSVVILNETAARQFGFALPQEAIGRRIEHRIPLEIIGIVPDVHFNSSHLPVRAFVYMQIEDDFDHITIDYRAGTDEAELRSQIDAIWHRLIPDVDPTIDYIDDRVAVQYLAETRQAQMLLGFSVLAVIVACLGLYGLAAFTAEQRTKEIAVRKVHGAGVLDIVKMLLIQFSKPVLAANLIAWPVAWYFMSDYLNGFTFRIDLGLSYFVITGILALLIAWLTTTRHAVKAARSSPAVVLKAE